jgi:L,D-transpeptidase-like protein
MAKTPVFTNSEDRHFVFNATHHRLNCFKSNGTLEWAMEARGEGTKGDSSKPFGNTPPGLYRVDKVETLSNNSDNKAYGPYRIALVPVELDKGTDRSGFYIHGGGSDLSQPFASEQGWEKTHGCIRVQNHSLGLIVNKVKGVQGKNGRVWVSVKWY